MRGHRLGLLDPLQCVLAFRSTLRSEQALDIQDPIVRGGLRSLSRRSDQQSLLGHPRFCPVARRSNGPFPKSWDPEDSMALG